MNQQAKLSNEGTISNEKVPPQPVMSDETGKFYDDFKTSKMYERLRQSRLETATLLFKRHSLKRPAESFKTIKEFRKAHFRRTLGMDRRIMRSLRREIEKCFHSKIRPQDGFEITCCEDVVNYYVIGKDQSKSREAKPQSLPNYAGELAHKYYIDKGIKVVKKVTELEDVPPTAKFIEELGLPRETVCELIYELEDKVGHGIHLRDRNLHCLEDVANYIIYKRNKPCILDCICEDEKPNPWCHECDHDDYWKECISEGLQGLNV